MKVRSVLLVATMAMSATLMSCASESMHLDIVATNSVLASIVRLAVGDGARVASIVPDGKDPHEFQPSAGDIAQIAGAAIVISNGFGYEPTLQKPIAQAKANGVPVFDVQSSVPALRDPHWFTDPVEVGEVVARLLPVLQEATGKSFADSSGSATAALRKTVESTREALTTVPSGKCVFAVEHILLSPFGERFGCPGSVVLNSGSRTPNAEPSATDIERFIRLIKEQGIKAVVEDRSEPSRILSQVSRQTGAELVKVSVHGMGGAVDYPGYILNIARSLAQALS